jgi:micrococcal nuclease
VVANNDAGRLSFRINIPNRPTLTPDMLISLFADTDANQATGDPESLGTDYVIELFQGQVNLFRWDGQTYTRRAGDPPSSSLIFSYQGGLSINISAAEFGNTRHFGFFVIATSGVAINADGSANFDNAHSDDAPAADAGLYDYDVYISAQPPKPKPPQPKPPSKPVPHSAIVVRSIYDGDTLQLANGKRVRLLQIDTPELGSGECYSRAARTTLVELVPIGSRITLEADPRLDKVDRYGRLLRYVHRGSMNVNLQLVKRGAAAPYFYRGDRGKYAARLLAEALQAELENRGLWGACPKTELDPGRAVDTGTSGPPTKAPPPNGKCDPNYSGACVPPPPPDLDCADLRARGLKLPVRVVGSDPHRLDGDHDGLGCETGGSGGGTPKPPPSPGGCDPNYRGACVPRVPYDLDCADIDGPVYVVGVDVHRFDGDGDGVGCES